MQAKTYVLVSACRNEAGYVEELIDTIAAQTAQPLRWMIVDDGSTDDTSARAEAKKSRCPSLQIARMPGGRPRSFSSQVYAAQHGAELLKGLPYDFIGFLDADIRVAPDYYARLIGHFESDPKLGLCGGAVIDQYEDRLEDTRRGSEDYHVAGGVQFFRRESFEKIGGYHAIEGGGQDTIADIMVMMHGWTIRVFPELQALHLRPDGYAKDNIFQRGIKWGRKFYLIGYHPVYYLGQCLRRVTTRPFVIASLAMLWGFIRANLQAKPRPVTPEFVRFLRRLQWRRLRQRAGL